MPEISDRVRALAPGLQLMSIATLTEEGLPWVRYVAGKMGSDLSLRFSTHLGSRKIAQLQRNPAVHVTLGASDFTAERWLQIEGRARISLSEEERRDFWFDGLRAYVSGIDDPEYAVVIVTPVRIEIASMTAPPEVWLPPL